MASFRAAGVLGLEVLPQTPQVIGPGVYCLARIQNDRDGWQPQATLNRSPVFSSGLLSARRPVPHLRPATEQPEAAEGVADTAG